MKIVSSDGTVETVKARAYFKALEASGNVSRGSRSGKNRKPKGNPVTSYIKPQRCPGDHLLAFGKVDYLAFKGGEGGRNWSVRSTIY